MELTDFCAHVSSGTAQQFKVILLRSKHYSPLAFDKILKYFSRFLSSSVQKIDLDQDLSLIQNKLYTTFLGQTSTFWFGDLSLLSSKKKRSDWLSLLQSYQGPHQIIGWLSEEDIVNHSSGVVMIEVMESYTTDMISKLSFLYDESKPEVTAYFFGRLYRVKKEYTLEQLSLLQSYASYLGKNMDVFFDSWLDQLVISDVSLFFLSQLFFEKRTDEFFIQWHQVRPYYSDQFWTAFFSEQLFKAYFFVQLQGRIPTEQKQLTYGLPFSFLKHDWKLYQPSFLQQAHEQIYTVDISLKSGGNVHCLDLFLAKFFAG